MISLKCSDKTFSKRLNIYLENIIFKKTKAFIDKCTFFIHMKTFWTVLNNQPMIVAINKINSRTMTHLISTFDFSSLYNDINHEKLMFILRELMNFCKGGLENYIAVTKFGDR